MDIRENDIFDYVFCKEKLHHDQIFLIEENKSLIPLVKFYTNLRSNLKLNIGLSAKIKLFTAIPDYKIDEFTLKPHFSFKFKTLQVTKILIAENAKVKTFIDSGNNFLVKAFSDGETTLITVVANTNATLPAISLQLFPSKVEVIIDSYLKPTDIGSALDIEEIRLKLIG